MAYNPSLYNPYGMPTFNQQNNQPIIDLVFMTKQEIDSYSMPAGSISRPLFIDDHHYAIKYFDQHGGSTISWFKTDEISYSDIADPTEIGVTKADFDAFKKEIMEVINGKHSNPDVPTTPAAEL